MARSATHWNPLLQLLMPVGFLACGSSLSLAADKQRCDPRTAPGVNCTCDLKSLRPLQGAVGMGEVQQKADKIKKSPRRRRANWPLIQSRSCEARMDNCS